MRMLKTFELISLEGVIQVRGSAEEDYIYGDGTAPYRTPASFLASVYGFSNSIHLVRSGVRIGALQGAQNSDFTSCSRL